MQVYAMPVFDLLEILMTKTLNFTPGIALRLITRTTYVGKFSLQLFCSVFLRGILW